MKQNKLLTLYKKIIPEYSRLMLPMALVWNLLAYYGGKLTGSLFTVHDVTSSFDALIPFVPASVITYVLAYPFWVVNYSLAARRDEKFAARFFCADFLTRLVCFVIFTLFPTTAVRPEVSGSGLGEWIISIVYFMDTPLDLFPSIHCIASLLSYAAVAGNKKIPAAYRIFSLVFAAAVSISAVLTKQHVHIDIIGGTAVMLICWMIAGIPKLSETYLGSIKKLQSKLRSPDDLTN